MADIMLFVCCHKKIQVPEHPLLVPIQVGAALNDSRFKGFLYDDSGDNISQKNRSYCELTAQYWAWKNIEADYYGFFHYRRYLYPDSNAKRPYIIEKAPAAVLLDKLGYDRFAELICKYDLIIPKGENMYIPVRKHYADAPFHHEKDLELAERIVCERQPEMTEAVEEHLSGTFCYFGNIYIMRRNIFHDYCKWLFPILEEFEHRADTSGYSTQEQRVDGYLAERLLGMYAAHLRRTGTASVLELPRVHFVPEGEGSIRRILNTILPPGSARRAFFKQKLKLIRNISSSRQV